MLTQTIIRMPQTLESRVAWAKAHYATARPAELAALVADLWQALHASQAAWGEQVAALDAENLALRSQLAG